MTLHEVFFPSDADSSSRTAAPLSSWIRSAGLRIVRLMTTCADYYAAATLYEQLSALSDAQLKRRGLSRDILARDVYGDL
jgi:hypothetical protein